MESWVEELKAQLEDHDSVEILLEEDQAAELNMGFDRSLTVTDVRFEDDKVVIEVSR